MDRMSPLDASFLHIENDVNHMHIGSVAIFDGPIPPIHEMKAFVAGKLPLVPRYRQRVRFVPLNLGQLVWVDDPHFYLSYHLRYTALPSPGGIQELRNLVGRVMEQQLDRTKPLWEIWIVENLEDGKWAMVSKVHHCMVDGVSGTDLLTVLLDDTAQGSPAAADPWRPAPEPSNVRLAGEALVGLVANPYEQYRRARTASIATRETLTRLAEVGRGLGSYAGMVRRTPESTLNGAIGPHRRWAWARTTLGEVKSVRSSLGGTVNDVVLTVITRGFRDLLLGRAEAVEDRVVRTLVPVSVRRPGERGTYNNRVSAMIAELPVGIEDARDRLASIRAQMDGLKDSKQAVAGEVLTSMSGFAPPMLLALGTRLSTRVMRFGTRNLNTVTTNVPGPQHPMYCLGRPLIEVFPYVPLATPVRIGIAIFSYNGNLTFGVTGDYDTAPDIETLCRGIEDGMGELLKSAAEQNVPTITQETVPAERGS